MGGSSSSSSDTKSTTTSIDQRVATAQGSVGISSSGQGAITINALDSGAIHDAFGFGRLALDGVISNAAASQGNIAAIASDALSHVQTANEHVSDQLANAYTEAKAGEQKILVAAGLMVIAIVAVRSFK